MSAIRPDLPAVFPPLSGAQAPVRAARSDFFKAALDAVQAGDGQPPVRAASAPAATSSASAEERLPRPGALLDIRV